ncbi:heterokaryon incompatibility protein-domain-containing protein, partial [Plectosphaerella cucumerina]
MEKYQYSSLALVGQIRLLRLHAGAEGHALSGDLVTTTLSETPRFAALSYVWGDSQPRKAIHFTGLRVEIGTNLQNALQDLRQPGHDTFLWADGICINQEDTVERSQQVKMMGDIYAAACLTVIWLGHEADEIKMAFGWLRRFNTVTDSLGFDMSACEDGTEFIARARFEEISQVAFGKHRTTAFRHIWALLNRPWFTRKWIIQELVKSQKPLMMAGKPRLSWAVLAHWINFLHWCPSAKDAFMLQCPRPLEAGARSLGIGILRATLLTRIAAQDTQLLMFLVARTLEFRCTDPRDHVFSVMGISSDADRFDLVDYRSPTEKVYRELAYCCLSDSVSLKLLWSLASRTPLTRRVRSWVPNIKNLAADGYGSCLATQFSVQQERDYDASGDTVLQARAGIDGNIPVIRGRIVDRLQRVGSDNQRLADVSILDNMKSGNVNSSRENIQRMMRQKFEWIQECLTIIKHTGSINEEEVFRNVLLDDIVVNNEVHKSLSAARIEFPEQVSLYQAMAYEIDYGSWLHSVTKSYSLESSRLLESMQMEKLQRRFGSTDKGRIGWLLLIASEGDLICVFDGMELPYAIRPAVDGR